jgi:hypothetical protein
MTTKNDETKQPDPVAALRTEVTSLSRRVATLEGAQRTRTLQRPHAAVSIPRRAVQVVTAPKGRGLSPGATRPVRPRVEPGDVPGGQVRR